MEVNIPLKIRSYTHVWTEVIFNGVPPTTPLDECVRSFNERHRELWLQEGKPTPRPARIIAQQENAYCRADECQHPHHDGPCMELVRTPEGEARCWCENEEVPAHVGLVLSAYANLKRGDKLLVAKNWQHLLGEEVLYLGNGRIRVDVTLRTSRMKKNGGCCG
jgi:hypothetical protein